MNVTVSGDFSKHTWSNNGASTATATVQQYHANDMADRDV
jgi:hypothetical protein